MYNVVVVHACNVYCMYCVFLSLLFLLLSTNNRLIPISSTRSNPPSSCTEDIWTLSSALESTPVCTDRNTRVHTLSRSAFRSHPDISRTWAFSSVAVLSAELYSAARFAELSSVLLVAAFRFHHRSHHYSKNDSNHRRRRRKRLTRSRAWRRKPSIAAWTNREDVVRRMWTQRKKKWRFVSLLKKMKTKKTQKNTKKRAKKEEKRKGGKEFEISK